LSTYPAQLQTDLYPIPPLLEESLPGSPGSQPQPAFGGVTTRVPHASGEESRQHRLHPQHTSRGLEVLFQNGGLARAGLSEPMPADSVDSPETFAPLAARLFG